MNRPGGFWNPKVNLHPIPDYKREGRIGWRLVAIGLILLALKLYLG